MRILLSLPSVVLNLPVRGPKGRQGRPRGGQWSPKGRQNEAKRRPKGDQGRPREAKGKPKEAKAEKDVSAPTLPHHFGTQNPTKIDQKALKNGFENNAKYKYVFELLSVPKILPKPYPKPPQNH